MIITYTLNEEDIKLAIKDYLRHSVMKADETFDSNNIRLHYESDELSEIFSATATPTKINPQK